MAGSQRNQSNDEVRAKYISALGAQFGEAFCDLFNHVAWLYSKWHDYQSLFGEVSTVDLLNKTAPLIFRDIQRIVWESLLLHLCRLTDPPQSARQDNLTLRRIDQMLPSTADQPFRAALASKVGDAVDKTGFARTWRNKQLAHTNLSVAAGGNAVSMPPAGKTEMQAAIDAIGEAMNCVERHYLRGTIGWEMFIEPPEGVTQLLYYLRKGFDAQEKEEAEERRRHGLE
jgi:hypothetical protein